MFRACILLMGLAVGLTGCAGSKNAKGQNRGQIGGEDAPDPEAFATVGMKTLPDNMAPIAVSGVGLVYRLQPGMGSSAPPGSWRQMLEANLKKQGFTHLKELLDDPNKTTSLVLVSATIPPGARKGEAVDIVVTLPEESKTASLKGGILLGCDLVDYETTGNLKSMMKEGKSSAPNGSLLLGSVWAKAEGQVVAGALVSDAKEPAERQMLDDIEAPSLRVGRVWGGGHVTQARSYYFMMKPGDQSIRMAANVAQRINDTFFGGADPSLNIADAKTRELVIVSVPFAYRNNHHRFLLVARQVPMSPVGAESFYRRQLEDQLHEPATTLTAAIKLEALGGNTRQTLRVALKNTSPWVRFAAAESLSYQGHTDGASELAKLAEEYPALRAYCLKALAASDDAAFTDRLVELMGCSDPVLRYGAFIALRLASENNPAAGGKLLNQSVWLHRVAPGSPGLIHLSGDRRSEIVIFGDGVKLTGPFNLPVGADFTLSMSATDTEVKITKIVNVNGGSELLVKKCPADVALVLEMMASLGARYAESVELLRRADAAQRLTAALVVDAIPRQLSIQRLAVFARHDPELKKANEEVARVGTIRTDLETAGVDFAADDPEAKPESGASRVPLSRQPGRIFGPKPAAEPPANIGEPLTPLTPVAPAATETTEPPEPAPVTNELSRNPGRLFPRK
ncbi:MAG TPA: flagellar basal body P-ring protein FlgI [Urbifossiella sp.]